MHRGGVGWGSVLCGDDGREERGDNGGEAHCSGSGSIRSGMYLDPLEVGRRVRSGMPVPGGWMSGLGCVCAMTMCWNANPVCLLTTQ